jgi:hypothetical protein
MYVNELTLVCRVEGGPQHVWSERRVQIQHPQPPPGAVKETFVVGELYASGFPTSSRGYFIRVTSVEPRANGTLVSFAGHYRAGLSQRFLARFAYDDNTHVWVEECWRGSSHITAHLYNDEERESMQKTWASYANFD